MLVVRMEEKLEIPRASSPCDLSLLLKYKVKAFILPNPDFPENVILLFTKYEQKKDFKIHRHFMELDGEDLELGIEKLDEKLRKKKRKMWISELTPNAIDYLKNLEHRIERINATYKRFVNTAHRETERHDRKRPDHSPEDFVPVLEGYPLNQVFMDQRKAYFKQCKRMRYYIWRK